PTYLPAKELSTAAQWCIATIESGREALSTCYGCPPLFSQDEQPDWEVWVSGLRLRGDEKWYYSIGSGICGLDLVPFDPEPQQTGPAVDGRWWEWIQTSNAGDIRVFRRQLDWGPLLGRLQALVALLDLCPHDEVMVCWKEAAKEGAEGEFS